MSVFFQMNDDGRSQRRTIINESLYSCNIIEYLSFLSYLHIHIFTYLSQRRTIINESLYSCNIIEYLSFLSYLHIHIFTNIYIFISFCFNKLKAIKVINFTPNRRGLFDEFNPLYYDTVVINCALINCLIILWRHHRSAQTSKPSH
jgi:hypothetical protein